MCMIKTIGDCGIKVLTFDIVLKASGSTCGFLGRLNRVPVMD